MSVWTKTFHFDVILSKRDRVLTRDLFPIFYSEISHSGLYSYEFSVQCVLTNTVKNEN